MFLQNINSQNSCPSNWGQATFSLVKYSGDIDKFCNEQPQLGAAVKQAANSNSGICNGGTCTKNGNTITLTFDRLKYNYNSVVASIKKFFKNATFKRN